MTRLSRSVLLSLGIAGVCNASPSPGGALSASSGNLNTRSSGRFLSFPIEQTTRDKPRVSRRQVDDTSAPLFNVSYVGYLIELSIGTPGQSVKVAIDTGSDELWVNPDCDDSDLLASQRRECLANGRYSAARSSTSSREKVIGPATEEIQYGIGYVEMEYTTDNIAFPGSDISLNSVQFAVATRTDDLNEGILGLSYGNGSNLVYPNLVDELYLQNVTESKAFSVGLGNLYSENSGVLIFGGIDTKKFTGELQMNPILGPQFRGDIHRYYLNLNSIGINRNGRTGTYAGSSAVAVLDTGASFSYFPESVLRAMARDIGGQYSSNAGLYLVPCSLLNEDSTFDFDFSGGVIKIPIRDMIIQDTAAQVCALAADKELEGSGIQMLLGDSFLRSVYVVFDQTTNTIGMAPYVDCGSNEQELPASGAKGFTGECDPNSQQQKDNAAGGRPVASYLSVWAAVAVGTLLSLAMV
ncbi:acid protease [Naviculisporaceae sp. PSN 640]